MSDCGLPGGSPTETGQVVESLACPGCGGPTRPVGAKTVKHLLRTPLPHAVWGDGFRYCADPGCDVYYVRRRGEEQGALGPDADLEVYTAEHVKERARPYASGLDRLVCHCFGYTVGDIVEDARSGRHLIPQAIAAEVRAGMCACEVMNPGGG